MEQYNQLAAAQDPGAREAGLDGWLARYGHRGPLESDLARPRFAELREMLWRDLRSAAVASPAIPSLLPRSGRSGGWKKILRSFFWMDERREWFRDATMRRWQRLRRCILEEGTRLATTGALDEREDVFWLRGCDLDGPVSLRDAVAAARKRAQMVEGIDLPMTASREAIEALLRQTGTAKAKEAGRRLFPGIPLSPAVIEGSAVKAADLTSLLAEVSGTGDLFGPDKILVVPSLEPSWAVVFPRVAGVVAEVGGELSHASILLREARRPAVVNCGGIFRHIKSGDRLRLDGRRGVVELLAPPGPGN
jgi:pyruvate,water dikinase